MTDNRYYACLGVSDSRGLAISATLAGVIGQQDRGDDNFTFDSFGKNLFNKDSVVQFNFKDGSFAIFNRTDCKREWHFIHFNVEFLQWNENDLLWVIKS